MSSFTRDELRQSAAWAALALVVAAVIGVNVVTEGRYDDAQDIYYGFLEGQRILAGENPYARVLEGDFRTNDKYATYFPLFYELSAASQWTGLRAYDDWLRFWRAVFACFDVGITILLFELCRRRGAWLLGVFAAALWGLGRWSLFIVEIGHLDFLPIFFLLLSLLWLDEKPVAAMLTFGLSLALKQFAIFLAPLYLVWSWQRSASIAGLVRDTCCIGAIPLLASLPFLLWNAPGFLASVLFSATRNARSHFGAYSIDAVLGLHGPIGRLPMLLVLAAVYALAATRTIGRYTSCLFTFAVFVDFNTVLYSHYPAWLVPFVPTTALDHMSRERPG